MSLGFRNLVGIGLVLLAAVAAVYQLRQDRSFEECLLNNMKGQAPTMMPTVRRLCTKKFNMEVSESYLTTLVNFGWTPGIGVENISVLQNDTQVEITRARFKFTAAECNDTKGESLVVEAVFTNRRATVVVPRELFGEPRCMHTVKVWGRYQ